LDDVAGYCNNTLGHALVTGALRHLVTLEINPYDGFDPGFLDSDEYGWCTPFLENLTVSLRQRKAASQKLLRVRKFFVNLTRLRRLSVDFEKGIRSEFVIEDVPRSVTELKVVWGFHTGSLPLVPQPGLEKLSVEANFIVDRFTVFGDLHLECRHGSLCFLP
jgi:hypothetical protein